MRNIRLTIEYDGSRYLGWTRLGGDEPGNTVSNKILDVLEKMTDERPDELPCGCRTEAGVHAYAQVASFKSGTDMHPEDIRYYLNRYLPMDIAITDVTDMPDRFHAHLNAKSKTYIYRITAAEVPSVFDRRHSFHCFKKPDTAVMRQAALEFVGKHDFKHFSSAKTSKTTVREIYGIDIYGDEEEMQILIEADDFLHNMARFIIGTLLNIGLGLQKKEDIPAIFAGSRPVGAACDPKALYLSKISY